MFTRNILVIWWAGVAMVWGWQLNQDFFERVLSKPLLWLDFHEKPRVIEFFRGYIKKNISHPNGLFWPSNFRFLGNSCNFLQMLPKPWVLIYFLEAWVFHPYFFKRYKKSLSWSTHRVISLIAVLNQTNGENGTWAGQFHGHNVNAKLCPEGLEMVNSF